MLIHDYGDFPEEYDYRYGGIEKIDAYDIDILKKMEIDEVWYWYAAGAYEGSGQILMRKGGVYDVHDMGHCSCYGPIENVEFEGRYKNLKDIKQKCSVDAWAKIAPLVKMATLEI